jgi:ElaB/YqjD/DUF883 family membrane-anchored ribosome-binding protein
MNKHEVHGGARYLGGKVEKAVGDVVEKRDWQVGGVVNQVAGGAENMFGRAQSVAEDVADATPHLIDEAREKIGDVADRSVDAAKRGAEVTRDAVRGNEGVAIGIGAAVFGYAIGWLVHGRRG